MCSEGIYDRYINFYTDFAFKKLFGTELNKELLISFLNSLLQGREHIEDITYLNTEHLGTQEYDRRAVFDVYCKNNRGEYFLVEMQKGEQQYFKDRSIYYSSFAIREQAPRGYWDYELKEIYTIGILNFCFEGSSPSYYHEVKLLDTETKEVFYDKLTFIYLEMPKFTKTENELTTLFDKWLYAIRNLASLMERPHALQEKVFKRLFEAAEIAKFEPKERYAYEESLKIYRDWFSVMETAKRKGLAEGLAEGREQGLEQGRAEGREQGRAEGREQGRAEGREQGRAEGREQGRAEGRTEAVQTMALKMKQEGISNSVIAKFTGMTETEIENL